MKKFLIAVLAVFFIAGLVGTAYAEDRLKISGSYRARWDWRDNDSDFNDDAEDEDHSFNQRFRTQFDLNVAEGISARLRTDWSDGTWGLNFTTARGGNRPNRGTASAVDIDRAYARWSTELFNLIVGLDFLSFGHKEISLDQQTTGIKLRLKLPVTVDLVYQMIDENTATNDDGANGDENFYGAQAAFKSGAWSLNGWIAGIQDDGPGDDSPVMVGVSGATSMGPFALTGQFEQYWGEVGTMDIIGTQFYAEAIWNVLPNAKIGLDGVFAVGTDDATEVQRTGLTDWGSWDILDRGTFLNTHFPTVGGIPNVTGGTGKLNPVMDPSGDSAGVIGFGIFGEYQIMDPLKIGANFHYLTPEEDGVTTLDSVAAFGVGVLYNWMTNTTLRVGYSLIDPDFDGGINADVSQHIIGMIQLTW